MNTTGALAMMRVNPLTGQTLMQARMAVGQGGVTGVRPHMKMHVVGVRALVRVLVMVATAATMMLTSYHVSDKLVVELIRHPDGTGAAAVKGTE